MKTTMIRSLLAGVAALLAAVVSVLCGVGAASAQAPGADGARFSTSAEYLLWWAKDSPAPPPLLSTGGVGAPDFSVVLGGRDEDTGLQSGGRFTAAYRLTPDWTIEGIGFFLADTSVTRTVRSSGEPGSLRLVVPQFRVDESREGVLTLAAPGDFAGAARDSLTSGMQGAELDVVRTVMTGPSWRLGLLGGFRYLRLREQLAFSGSSTFVTDPDVFSFTDVFDTDNHFYGGQLGLKAQYSSGRWFAEATTKVALGVMRQSVDVAGTLLTNDFNGFGTPQVFQGGVFAQPTNIGSHTRDRFAVVPEAGLKVGYRLTSWASLFVGYTFLYANAVVRPGNQVDRNINTTQAMAFQIPQTPPPTLALAGEARPAGRVRESDFWVQGLNVGVTFGF
jgi:hypothetical protein